MAYKNKEDAIKNNKKWRDAHPNYSKERYTKNREKLIEYNKNWRRKNHKRILEKEREWREKNREKCREQSRKFEKSETRKKWREKNKEIIKEKKKQKYDINKETVKEQSRKYREKNPKKVKEIQKRNYQNHKSDRNAYHKNKRIKDPSFLIRCRLATNLWTALKKYTKTGKTFSSSKYGINYKSIIEYLKPFPKNISKYQIDHIRPLCSFTFINEEGNTDLNEIKKAFAPENHQWLTAQENLSKGGRY